VTGNAFDFRGPAATPGAFGGYAGAAIHAGLICPNRPHRDSRALQVGLLQAAIDVLDELDGDLVNQVLEVTLTDQDTIQITLYALPAET
jgi:hypothetical protein